MYKRVIEKELFDLSKGYPIVTVIGPRQSGKTTLVQKVFSDKPYVNLENLDIRAVAETDPRAFLQQYKDGAIFDEIQQVPKLLSYIQPMVDERKEKGLFILTGSHQFDLHQAISQSLAGRTALLTLLPLSSTELQNAGFNLTIDELLLMGGYPRIFNDQLNPTKAYRNYLQTYIEKDLRQLIHVKDLIQFQKFIRLCAGRIGQLLSLENLGNEVGVSSHTIKHWISILEASFIIIRLQPYYENFGKRIIKSPKLYFTDVGLASYLLGIENIQQIERDPLRGSLFENLVLLELVKARLNRGLDPHMYYYRDSHGREIDFIYQKGRQLIPVEVKSSMTFTTEFLKNVEFFKQLIGDRFEKGFVIYAGSQEYIIKNTELLHFCHTERVVS